MNELLAKYPVIKLSAVYMLGIIAAKVFHLPLIVCALVFAVGFGVALYLAPVSTPKRDIAKNIFLYIAVLAIGALSLVITDPAIVTNPFSNSFRAAMSAKGTITDVSLWHEQSLQFQIQTDTILYRGKLIPRNCLIQCSIKLDSLAEMESLYQALSPGDEIVVRGAFTSENFTHNPGVFDYYQYLHQRGIVGILRCNDRDSIRVVSQLHFSLASARHQVRKAIAARTKVIFNEETAGLLQGLILGDKNDISDDMQDAFVNAGVAHILAVSGLNVAYISFLLFLLLGRLSLRQRYIGAAIGIILFWLVAGNSPPVVRAVFMGLFVVYNGLSNRQSNSINTLFLTALVVLILSPADLFTASFQLSFIGVFSLLAVYPPLEQMTKEFDIRYRWMKKCALILALSFAAQLGVAPITDYYFAKFSITAVLANAFVIPVSSAIMGAGIFALIVSAVWTPLAIMLGDGCNAFTYLMYKFILFSGGEGYSYLHVSNFTLLSVMLYYLVLAAYLIALKRFIHLRAKIALTIVVCCMLVLFQASGGEIARSNGDLKVMFLDVGQGDAALIRFPDNTTLLIDAGNASKRFDNGRRTILQVMNRQNISKIDYAVITHMDNDHFRGIWSLIAGGYIRAVIKPARHSGAITDSLFEVFAGANNVKIIYAADSVWHIGTAKVYFLGNDRAEHSFGISDNNESVCMKLCYGKNSFLFTGDAETQRENALIEQYGSFLDSDVLKVGHHGSKNSSGYPFLNLVTPDIAVISAGKNNQYHHPSPQTINRLQTVRAKIYRTDQMGAVILRSNGNGIKVIPE
jgi:competence protein ComEC